MMRPGTRPTDMQSAHGDTAPGASPAEIPCYGPSPVAVRRTIAGLMAALPQDLRIGCVTDPSLSAPAPEFPPSPGRVVITAPSWDSRSWRAALADCDLVFTEGRPKPDCPGILIFPDDGYAAGATYTQDAAGTAGSASGLFACVSPDPGPSALPEGLPRFVPGDAGPLADLILTRLRAAAAPLYGLVLVGGRSARMRADKASLVYHGKPQAEHCLDLLATHCAQSFLSCREDQAGAAGFAGMPQIHDTFLDMGPLGGILSALRAHRRAAFLVVACDLPFLDRPTLAALVAGRDPLKIATAFSGSQEGLPEPLCAIYEPGSYGRMLQLMGQGVSCPRKFLLNSSSRILTPPDLRSLINANDPEAYSQALRALAP